MSWTRVSSPNPGHDYSQLTGVTALAADNAWAVGSMGQGRSHLLTLIEHWDGTSWTQVPSPSPGPRRSVLTSVYANSADDIWAAGYHSRRTKVPLVEHWDGSSWSVVKVPNPAYDSVAEGVSGTSATDVTVVGTSGGDMGLQPFAEQWDGSAWTVTYPPTSEEPYVSTNAVYAATPDDQWAVGTGGGNDQALVEHWDGTAWSGALLGGSNASLYGVAGTASDNVWAVGMTYAGGGERALLEQWNGRQWNSFDGPSLPPSEDPTLEGVTALSVDDAWAVGWYFHTAAKHYAPLVLHWDGTSWTRVRAHQTNRG